jgi:hypothetical protein
MSNPARLIQTILVIAAVLGAIGAVIMGALFGVRVGFSSAIGTAIGMANLWALARLVVITLDAKSSSVRRGRAAIFLGLKFIALVSLVGFLVIQGYVHGGALMAGISVVALSIVVGALLRSGDDDNDENAAFASKKENSIDA